MDLQSRPFKLLCNGNAGRARTIGYSDWLLAIRSSAKFSFLRRLRCFLLCPDGRWCKPADLGRPFQRAARPCCALTLSGETASTDLKMASASLRFPMRCKAQP
jgi:hypothetical protein